MAGADGTSSMTLVGYRARNHPQQVSRRGPRPEIDERGTDPQLFAELHSRFQFTLDVCATAENAVLPRYYSPAADGLEQTWSLERVWCNPPYSGIGSWVAKAVWEAVTCPVIVMLVPANRTEQSWWQREIEPVRDGRHPSGPRVEFLPGRPRFVNLGKPGIGPNERPPFGCCLLIWECQNWTGGQRWD